jgi:hypothetical protein
VPPSRSVVRQHRQKFMRPSPPPRMLAGEGRLAERPTAAAPPHQARAHVADLPRLTPCLAAVPRHGTLSGDLPGQSPFLSVASVSETAAAGTKEALFVAGIKGAAENVGRPSAAGASGSNRWLAPGGLGGSDQAPVRQKIWARTRAGSRPRLTRVVAGSCPCRGNFNSAKAL